MELIDEKYKHKNRDPPPLKKKKKKKKKDHSRKYFFSMHRRKFFECLHLTHINYLHFTFYMFPKLVYIFIPHPNPSLSCLPPDTVPTLFPPYYGK